MTPYYEDETTTIYHGECLEVMDAVPLASPLVVTDPPYVIPLQSSRAKNARARWSGWADLMNGAVWCTRVFEAVSAVVDRAGGDGAIWLFQSWRGLPTLMRAAHDAQIPITSLLIWNREGLGTGPKHGLRSVYEVVLLCARGDWGVVNRSTPDVWSHPWPSTKPHHPAEKPVGLLERMLAAGPGDVVLDPFMGSGSTLIAAKRRGIRSIGIESEERYCECAVTRMQRENGH